MTPLGPTRAWDPVQREMGRQRAVGRAGSKVTGSMRTAVSLSQLHTEGGVFQL